MAIWGNIGAVLYKLLKDDATASAIYGTRIYPLSFNTNTTTYPCIVYTVTDIDFSNTKGNRAQGVSKLDVYEVQLALFHETYDEMISGMKAVREVLDYDQDIALTIGGEDIRVQAISFTESRQDYMDEYADNGLFVSYIDINVRQTLQW